MRLLSIMREKAILVIGLLTLLFPLSAQMKEGKRRFPIRLFLHSEDNTILMEWSEAEIEVLKYNIYRATGGPIDDANFPRSERIASVPPGIGQYTDYPPLAETPYFYAILAVSPNGEEQRIFVPYSNVNFHGLMVLYTQKTSSQLAAVTKITAEADFPEITLTFQTDRRGRELLVYRHTLPIRTPKDFIKAIPLGRIPSDSKIFRDVPIPGVNYYYAIVDSQALLSREFNMVPGDNTTAIAAALPYQNQEGPNLPSTFSLRPRPLPYLSQEKLYSGHKGMPQKAEPHPLSAKMKEKIDELLEKFEGRIDLILQPTLLEEDLVLEEEYGDSRLLAILNKELLPGHWKSARTMLTNYARLSHPPRTQNRLYFYLGQIAFFEENYRDALMNFLFAEEDYHKESRDWIWMSVRNVYRTIK